MKGESKELKRDASMGRTMTLVFRDGQEGRPEPKPIWNRDADPGEFPDKMVSTPVWVVTEVEGVSAGDGEGGEGLSRGQ